jgi:hypothetical protein
MADLSEPLPDPTPLWRALLLRFQWGSQKFKAFASACSVPVVAWEGEEVTWLHCKAVETKNIKADGTAKAITALIPARYVTFAEAGPPFLLTRSRPTGDLGFFPPTKPPPAAAVPWRNWSGSSPRWRTQR